MRFALLMLVLSCCAARVEPAVDPLVRWQQKTRGLPIHVWDTNDRYDCDWHCVDIVMMEGL